MTNVTKSTAPVSGDAAILSRRYADAFYELAEENKIMEQAAADIRALAQLADTNTDFAALAGHPRLSRVQLVKLAGTVADALKLNPLTGKFLSLVGQQRRLSLLSAIAAAFLARLATARGEMTATVRSATALTPQQTQQLTERLSAMSGSKVQLDVREDKSLIGGLTVRIGSRLIDASVKNRLERLERALKSEAA